jgi:Rps23 Pro-64 3,4-dihydroxylase Tpa1-like proline 4-hydroxylase
MSHSFPKHFFPPQKLELLAKENKHKYQTAKPFSHAYFDDVLPVDFLNEVLREFPNVEDKQWQEFKAETENGKLASTRYDLIPPTTRYVLDQLNTPPFLAFLEELTGIDGLIPDPYYTGGGMHQTKRGGHLGVHVDFNRYEKLGLYRRVNVLLYLNKDWKDEYGGHLELWDEKMEKCHDKIAPLFNRMAIFTTSENSHHGHPDPLMCQEGTTRKSLAWYYYTATSGGVIDDTPHTTLYHARPGKDASFKLLKIKLLIRSLLPPVLTSALTKIRNMLRK